MNETITVSVFLFICTIIRIIWKSKEIKDKKKREKVCDFYIIKAFNFFINFSYIFINNVNKILLMQII